MNPLTMFGRRRPRWTSRIGAIAVFVLVAAAVMAVAAPTPSALAGSGVWTTAGPRGGGVSAVAVNPAGTTEYIGTQSGGFMKSTNGGATWVVSNAGILGGNTSGVTAIAIAKSSPSTMFIADDGSLYKSTNAGASWAQVGSGIEADVDGIAVDPVSPSIVYVASDFGGMYKSTNGGSSFVAINTGLPRNSEYNVVRVDPTTHTTLYAGGFNGIYKSTNSGSSWAHMFTGIPFGVGANDLAIDPANNTILLAATDNGLYRSVNSGASWAPASGGSSGNSFVVFGTGSSAGIDYAGGFGGIIKSTSSGSSWSAVNSGIPTAFGSAVPASAIAIDPALQSTLFVGLSYPYAVYKSTTSAGSWAAASAGINQIATGGLAVLSSTTFLVGTEGTSSPIYKTTNDGASFSPSSSGIPAFAGISAFQVISPTKIYALTFEGLYVTSNGGSSWSLVPGTSSLSASASAFAVQSNNNSHIDILSFFGTVSVTTNGGSSWTTKNPACFPLATFAQGALSLAMEPGSSVDSAIGTSAGVFTTANDWTSCTKAAGTLPVFVFGVSFDPFHPTSLWAWGFGTSKATFGSSFSAVSSLGSVEADDLWFNPASSGNILVGADGQGVLQSTNGGSSFTAITNSGLVTPSFTGVGKAGTTIAAALPGNSVAVIVP
jgi:photosystem II stability/assembly factor-like uncharacterized protein